MLVIVGNANMFKDVPYASRSGVCKHPYSLIKDCENRRHMVEQVPPSLLKDATRAKCGDSSNGNKSIKCVSSPSSNKICLSCGEIGHIKRDCPVPFCKNCKISGHHKLDCPLPRSPYCPICKTTAHGKSACSKFTCNKCGGIGHTGNKCIVPARKAAL